MINATTFMMELQPALKAQADAAGFAWPCALAGDGRSIAVTPGVCIDPNFREVHRKPTWRSRGGGSKFVGVTVYTHDTPPGFALVERSVNDLYVPDAVKRLMPILTKLTVSVQQAQAGWEGRIDACVRAAEEAGFGTARELANTRCPPTLQITSADHALVAYLDLTTWRLKLDWEIPERGTRAFFNALARLRGAVQWVTK